MAVKLRAYRHYNGEKFLIAADDAVSNHQPNEVYTDPDTGEDLQLHVQRKPNGPQTHFETRRLQRK